MASAMKQAKDFANFSLTKSKQLAKYNNQLERENVALQHSYNQALAQENRDWQEMMSNTAHQREIADLKAAGLNPVLSITGGAGASTPSGSAGSVSKPNVDMSLPGKVMDMAMSQLSSATALQTTAMQTANALTIAREQIANQWAQHVTPSGNSLYGQYRALFEDIISLFNPDSTSDNSSTNSSKSGSLFQNLINFFKGSAVPSKTKYKLNTAQMPPIKLNHGNPTRSTNGSNKNGSNYSKYSNVKGKTDIDELYNALKSPLMDKYGNSDKVIRVTRRRNFWKSVRNHSRNFSNSSRR